MLNTKPLTPERIAELVELYERTTRGAEWRYIPQDNLIEMSGGGRLIDYANPRSCAVSEEQRNANGQFTAAAHNAMPALIETLAEKDARANRFAVETCDLDHSYAFEVGKEKPHCPFCLAQGLELARAEIRDVEAESDSLRAELQRLENEWKVIDGIKVTIACSSHGGNVAVFYADSECPLCNAQVALQQKDVEIADWTQRLGLMQIRELADTDTEGETKRK